MIRHIYDFTGARLLRTEEATPRCGRDFCDSCGDCLACEGDRPCRKSGTFQHFWVHYEKEAAALITAAVRLAKPEVDRP